MQRTGFPLALLVALVLLAGCLPAGTGTAPTPGPAPAAGGAPAAAPAAPDPSGPQGTPATPPAAPTVVRSAGTVRVTGLRFTGLNPYLWSPDGAWVAFQVEGGIWAMSPDGEVTAPVAPGPRTRVLVGWNEEAGLVWLEEQPAGLAVMAGAPGRTPRTVAVLTEDQVGPADRRGRLWFHLAKSRLLVAADLMPVWRIDLAAGRAEMVSPTPVPTLYGEFAVAPDGRTLAFKNAHVAEPVRLMDLTTGAVTTPTAGEAHLAGVAWAPAVPPAAAGSGAGELRWAVRAAKPGSGLPVAAGAHAVEGATHVTVGDAAGRVRHLEPPEPLSLIDGPFWSPDGRWLAVTAGVVRGMESGMPTEIRPTSVWAVAVDSGRWVRLGNLTQGSVAGWHPDGRHLLVQPDIQRVERWPLEGSATRAAPHPWLPEAAAALPGGGTVYLTLEPAPRLVLERPGHDPVTLLAGPGHKSDLEVRGGHAAVLVSSVDDWPQLAVIRLP